MAWQKNGTPDSPTSSGTMTIADLIARKFNLFLCLDITSGSTGFTRRFNNNSNSVYVGRRSFNGGTDSTAVSQTNIDFNQSSASDKFLIEYVCSILGEEKLTIAFSIFPTATGAGTAPSRDESVTKFVPSPDADITEYDIIDGLAGDYVTGSNLSALGTN